MALVLRLEVALAGSAISVPVFDVDDPLALLDSFSRIPSPSEDALRFRVLAMHSTPWSAHCLHDDLLSVSDSHLTFLLDL